MSACAGMNGVFSLVRPECRTTRSKPTIFRSMDVDGRWFGRCRPSSEWRFHRDVFRSRHEVAAIVHTHSPKATSLACTGRGIPAFHYMVAVAGGPDIRCAPYHTFGTQDLSDAAVAALEGRKACLLANHGVIAVGADLPAALALAAEVENLAAQYCTALALGKVRILSETEMGRVAREVPHLRQTGCNGLRSRLSRRGPSRYALREVDDGE